MHGEVVVPAVGVGRGPPVALTASCPSRNTLARTMNSSSTTDLAGRVPPSTSGRTSLTGMRPIGSGATRHALDGGGCADGLLGGEVGGSRLGVVGQADPATGVAVGWAVAFVVALSGGSAGWFGRVSREPVTGSTVSNVRRFSPSRSAADCTLDEKRARQEGHIRREAGPAAYGRGL